MFGLLAYRDGLNVQSLLAARFLVAGVLMGAYVLARRLPLPRGRTLLGLVAMGGVGYVGQSAAYFNSIRFVPAAVTSVLLYTYPAIVVVLSRPLYGAPLSRRRVAAVLVALAGVALVANPRGGLRWEGVALGLVAAVTYSGYILLGKRILADVQPLPATAVVMLSAGVAYLGFALGARSLVMPRTMGGVATIAGIAVIATIVAAGAFLAGLSRTDPGHASLISTLEPVSTALLALVVFGQVLGPLQVLGALLVLSGVVLVARAPASAVVDVAPAPGPRPAAGP